MPLSEAFWVAVVLAWVALTLSGTVLSVVLLVRMSRLQRRLQDVERELNAARPQAPVPQPPPAPAPSAPPAVVVAEPVPTVEPLYAGLEAAAHTTEHTTERGGVERWLGVRGAAVLGGIALAIAGFLFVQYSIQRGLLGPEARITIGVLLGLGAWLGSIPLVRKQYVLLGNALYAGGTVALFAAAWAAHALYGLLDMPYAFAGMCAVTAISGWTAVRRDSQVIAILGLVGGFATPLVLSRGGNHPIQLFGYVLLLDLAYLFVASKRRWPSVATVAVLGTAVLQAAWLFLRAEATDGTVALVVLGLFALLFAGWTLLRADAAQRGFTFGMAAALLLPFAFAAYFAHEASFGPDLWPLAVLAVCLSSAALLMAVRSTHHQLAVGAAAGSISMMVAWCARRDFVLESAQAWQLAGSLVALALVFAVGLELSGRSRAVGRVETTRLALAVFALPALLLWMPLVTLGVAVPLHVLVLVLVVVCALLVRRLAHGGRPEWTWAGALVAGVVVWLWSVEHPSPQSSAAWPDAWVGALCLILLTSTVSAVALWLVPREQRAAASVAPALLAFGVAAAIGFSAPAREANPSLWALALVLALLPPLVAAVRAQSLVAQALTSLAAALSLSASSPAHQGDASARHWILTVGAVCFSLVPIGLSTTAQGAARTRAWQQRIAAILWVALTPMVVTLMRERYQLSSDVWPVVGWALVAVGLRAWAGVRCELTARHAWLAAAIVLGALSLAEVRPEWLVGPALAFLALGLMCAWRSTHHAPFAHGAGAAAAIAGLVLVLRLPTAELAEARWFWNDHAWNLLLPALCMGGAAALAVRAKERFPSLATGSMALLVGFAWLNVAIIDGYAVETVQLNGLGRLPQRDFVLSIAWAGYSLALLVLGVQTKLVAARWGSLALLLLTIGKVFLVDLGRLEGLWRATSMLGLAVSLLLVSFLYQRFVFRKDSGDADAATG